MFHNMICFYCVELLAPHPTPNLKDDLLFAVRDCLFKIFTANLHIGGHSSICNLRACHAMVKGPTYHVMFRDTVLYLTCITFFTDKLFVLTLVLILSPDLRLLLLCTFNCDHHVLFIVIHLVYI